MMVQEGQAKFLRQMVRIFNPTSILDIGTFTGTSTIVMASAIRGDGKVVSLDVDPKAQAVARRNIEKLQLQDRVDLRLGKALESLNTLTNEKPQRQFDLIFIDANKDEYISYFDFIMDHDLLSDRGVIIADNVLYFGLVHRDAGYEEKCPIEVSERFRQNSRCIENFNQHVVKDPRVEVTMVPLFDGVSFIRKKD
ncbi:O-methyltransferase [Fennellomyces sp. T-0311]|nr:O-methyltransferase [Fennellomyces sp. T-0311]